MLIDREINLNDNKDADADEYCDEVKKQAEMERKLRSFGTELPGGGYTLNAKQLLNFFKSIKEKKGGKKNEPNRKT